MDRFAVFVDAGYFFAAGSQAAFGDTIPRKQIAIKSPSALITSLNNKAKELASGLPLLRTYWYDTLHGPRLSQEQSGLALLPGVKLRLGASNAGGEMKNLDSLLVSDLMELARNRAIADAVIVTGDEDLRIAVQLVQAYGVRVHILAAGEASRNVSAGLQMEADSVSALNDAWFSEHFDRSQFGKNMAGYGRGKDGLATAGEGGSEGSGCALFAPRPMVNSPMPESSGPLVASEELEDAANNVIKDILDELDDEQLDMLAEHFETQNSVPPEYDRKMIARVAVLMSGRRLSGDEMRHIRGLFVRAAKRRSDGLD